ncbi:Ferric enterobactin transport system permease protein FepG [Baekduia alba]|uniref:FecCD family ABC transporter permease n=1 Tax=Baekduia alba TaxID=2997333 RepID=UPI00234047A7|nr:iron chelate uptake ABC transporter family permease subunit [Baekduia alba]WCB95039.1 Ferric enterobactin transport system permease protein FepG [Baekduia alba]
MTTGGLMLRIGLLHRAGVFRTTPPRVVVVGAVLTVACAALLVVAVGTGDYPIAPLDVVDALLGRGDTATSFVVETLRLPRALTALLVGAALGAAGAVFQSIARNPLGSPDIIGFTAGSSAAAVFEIAVIGGGTAAIAAGSIVGGLLTAFLVYTLAWRRGGVQGYRLVLIGIGVSATLEALTNYLLTRARIEDIQRASVWLAGSLNGRGWEHVWPTLAGVVLLLPVAVAVQRPLRMIEMGDDAARALGVSVERARLGALLAGTLLTAVATAAAGPVTFVALAAPQIGRRLTGATGPGVMTAALTGSVLLLASDVLAQRLFPSTPLPVGVMTGGLGGLYLVWLLAQEARKGRA